MAPNLTSLLLAAQDIAAYVETHPSSVQSPDLQGLLDALRTQAQALDDALFTDWWERDQAEKRQRREPVQLSFSWETADADTH